MATKVKKPTKREYEESLVQCAEADGYYPCKTCGWPVKDGYCCNTCGDTNPSEHED